MEESLFPLNSLPNLVLVAVFLNLPVKDRLRNCLVCKKWLDLMNCRSLLGDIIVYIKCSNFDDYPYTHLSRDFLNFDVADMTADDIWRTGVEFIRPCVEYLRMGAMDIRDETRKVDVLNNTSYRVVPSCPNLLTLILHSNIFTDAFLANLQRTMKRLKVFALHNVVVYDPPRHCAYYPPGVTYEVNPSSDVLSFLAIKSFVSERVSTLSEIDLDHSPLDLSTLKELLCIKGLNLTKLRICTKERNSPDGYRFFVDIFQTHRYLKTLELSGFNLNDDFNNVFCSFLPNIENLQMSCNITDESLQDVFNLRKLKKLLVVECTGFTPSGCREAISRFKPIELKHLELKLFPLHEASAYFFKEWTHLIKLNLTRCLVTDSHVHVISTYLVNLEHLNLSENDITDYGLAAVSEPERNPDNSFSDNTTRYEALHNLLFLLKLDLSWCRRLTVGGLNAAIRFPFLHTLLLFGHGLSERTYSVIRSQNPKLVKLRP